MKRIFTSFLMLLAMIIVSTVSFAQNGGGNYAASGLQDGNRMMNMHSKVFTGNVQPTLKSGSDITAKNKRIKTASGDLWYAKPEGTFYKNTFPSASLVVPPFTTLTFENKSTQIESTSWSLNGETISNGTSSYQSVYPALRETAYFPAPQLSIGKDTFALGITGAKGEVACQIATKETVDNLSKTDYVVGGSYVGWADLPGFPFKGMRDLDGDGKKEAFEYHTLVQHYAKPASPFYLTSLRIPFSSYQTAKDMIPEGKEITVRIDKGTYGNTIATGRITKAEIDETSWIEDPKENVTYAGPVVYFDEGPLVLDDEFFIVVKGLEECVDMGFWVTLPDKYEQETEANRTRTEGVDSVGNPTQMSWSYVNGKDVLYWEAIIYLAGMFDVAQIDTNLVAMNAPAQGGVVVASYQKDEEVVEDSALIFRSSRPYISAEGEQPSYTIEGLPDWLKIQSVEDTDDKLTRIMFVAEPYEGTTPDGREASLRIVSDFGACTEFVTISQIPMVGDSFTTLTEEGKSVSFTITDAENNICEVSDVEIGEEGDIIIPETIWGYTVSGIADSAFCNREDLTEITINFAGTNPLGGKIGKNVFGNCPNLEKITIGQGVRELSDSAFVDCLNLKTIVSLIDQDDLWSFNENVFAESVFENAMLIVPTERVGQYQETNGWNHFQNIMDPETALSIKMPNADVKAMEIYMLDGRRSDRIRSGVNIIRNSDGTVRKLSTK